jgi:hypothetical protein
MANLRILSGAAVTFLSLSCSSGGGGAAPPMPDGGVSMDPSEQCQTQLDHCPPAASERDADFNQCLEGFRQYEAIGCDSQYASWVACTGSAAYSCDTSVGCDTQQSAYVNCQSRFVAATGCERLAAQDAVRCQASAPYAFSCLRGAPSSCLLVVDAGAGIWCCPQLGG